MGAASVSDVVPGPCPQDFSFFPNEGEFLLPPMMHLKVISVKEDYMGSKGLWLVVCKQTKANALLKEARSIGIEGNKCRQTARCMTAVPVAPRGRRYGPRDFWGPGLDVGI